MANITEHWQIINKHSFWFMLMALAFIIYTSVITDKPTVKDYISDSNHCKSGACMQRLLGGDKECYYHIDLDCVLKNKQLSQIMK